MIAIYDLWCFVYRMIIKIKEQYTAIDMTKQSFFYGQPVYFNEFLLCSKFSFSRLLFLLLPPHCFITHSRLFHFKISTALKIILLKNSPPSLIFVSVLPLSLFSQGPSFLFQVWIVILESLFTTFYGYIYHLFDLRVSVLNASFPTIVLMDHIFGQLSQKGCKENKFLLFFIVVVVFN